MGVKTHPLGWGGTGREGKKKGEVLGGMKGSGVLRGKKRGSGGNRPV